MVAHTVLAPEIVTDFEAESVADRLGRRMQSWIGTVEVSPPLPELAPE